MFGKSFEATLAAVALLAENHSSGVPLTTEEIAGRKRLPRPFVAKLLTALGQAGIVTSKPGRHGGFLLARPPEQLTLNEVANAVGYRTRIRCCPFGPEYGDNGERGHCPMHEQISNLRHQIERVLSENTLDVFSTDD